MPEWNTKGCMIDKALDLEVGSWVVAADRTLVKVRLIPSTNLGSVEQEGNNNYQNEADVRRIIQFECERDSIL